MSAYQINTTSIKSIFFCFALLGGIASYASDTDTFKLSKYKIIDCQLKRCLSKIAKEQIDKHKYPVTMVIINYKQGDNEYFFVGCANPAVIPHYAYCTRNSYNNCMGCSYLNGTMCLLYGDGIKKYLSDSLGSVSKVDYGGFYKPLLGSETDYKEWLDSTKQDLLHVDPPAWSFKRQNRKLILIDNDIIQNLLLRREQIEN